VKSAGTKTEDFWVSFRAAQELRGLAREVASGGVVTKRRVQECIQIILGTRAGLEDKKAASGPVLLPFSGPNISGQNGYSFADCAEGGAL